MSDINECQENPHVCTHYCTNTLGSYYCSCDEGYTFSEEYGCTANGIILYCCDIIVSCPFIFFLSHSPSSSLLSSPSLPLFLSPGPPPYLLYTNWFDIQKVNDTVSGSSSVVLLRELRNAASLAYHYKYMHTFTHSFIYSFIVKVWVHILD